MNFQSLGSAKSRAIERNHEYNRLQGNLYEKKMGLKPNYTNETKSSRAFTESVNLESCRSVNDMQRQSQSSLGDSMQGN